MSKSIFIYCSDCGASTTATLRIDGWRCNNCDSTLDFLNLDNIDEDDIYEDDDDE